MTRRAGVLRLDLRDRDRLYMAWMGFIRGGGLFVPTEGDYTLGDEVFVRVDLPDTDSRGVAGKVVWITPKGALKPREPGIGIRISRQDSGELQRQAEAALAGRQSSDRPTRTL